MRAKSLFQKLVCITLAFLLILAAGIPAFAEGSSYTITIEPSKFTDTSVPTRFGAYQIFTGSIDTTTNTTQLSDVKWGNGVAPATLLAALKNNAEGETNLANTQVPQMKLKDPSNLSEGYVQDGNKTITIHELFANVSEYNADPEQDESAAEVANILRMYGNNSLLAKTFAKIAGECLSSTKYTSKYNTGGNGDFTIQVPAGYYLIKDEILPDGKNDAATEYILGVFKNIRVELKASIPDVSKEVLGNKDGQYGATANYEIGQEFSFRLTGTLPENYGQFNTYAYKFTDTLTSGLTYKGGLTVKVVNKGATGAEEVTPLQAADYTFTAPEGENGGTLTLNFDDLKKTSAASKIVYGSQIIVEYKAVLNQNAVIGGGGNLNKVYLEFSNNPNGDGIGKTEEKEVKVYSFGLDMRKENGAAGTTGKYMNGVGFKLYSTKIDTEGGSKTMYAIFQTDTETTPGKTIYKLAGWTENESEATELFTADDTSVTPKLEGKLYVEGLGEGRYNLKETTTPTGFNSMHDVTFDITPTIDTTTNLLTGLAGSIANDRTDASVSTGNTATGLIPVVLKNYPGATLPTTGGIGTTIFYIVGGVLVLGAGVLLIARKRMSAQR
ncbi:MAG: isopeptide-forming domain-containing fimbrial protein [Clostridiales bacterium]|nr:isopeptide-forming domain-containing fimbrial protein [Clostridiales bacterium]